MPETQAPAIPAVALAAEVLCQALETMAFVSPLPAEKPVAPSGLQRISITFGGCSSGRVELLAPLQLGAVLAGNILGIEASAPEAQHRAPDALKEAMNVTCGLLLARLAADQSFDMGIPQLADAGSEDWDAFVQSGATVLDADGLLLAIQFQWPL